MEVKASHFPASHFPASSAVAYAELAGPPLSPREVRGAYEGPGSLWPPLSRRSPELRNGPRRGAGISIPKWTSKTGVCGSEVWTLYQPAVVHNKPPQSVVP